MKAVVLCAGAGSRLGSMTKNVPKAMLPLKNRPLLAYILDYLAKSNIREIAVNVHFFAKQIIEHFKDGSEYNVSLHYSYEEELLGTAGALVKLAAWLEDEDCLVLYGDVLTDQDISILIDTHHEENSFATLLLHKRKKSNSIVKMNGAGRITYFKERPSEQERVELVGKHNDVWVNSGIQVVSKDAVRYIIDTQAFDLPRDVYCRVVDRKQIFGVPLVGFRMAIDSPERYYEAQRAIEKGNYQTLG
jgi:NDP-sugar pyrophosphorylase family protein